MNASPLIRRFITRLYRHPPLAHHPPCRCYDDHLLRLGRLSLCLGCTCLAVGLLVAVLVLTWATQHAWDALAAHPRTLFLIGLALLVPTFAQPFVQVRPFKMVSRLLLGVAIPVLWFAPFALLPWTLAGLVGRAGFVLLFAGLFLFASWLRKRYTPRPCATCPHGRYPFCADNRPRVERLLLELRRQAGPDEVEAVEQVSRLIDENTPRAHAELASLLPGRVP